jgi:hypothetical protein
VQYEVKTEPFGSFDGRRADRVGAPPSWLEGGSWGLLSPKSGTTRGSKRCHTREGSRSYAPSPVRRACSPHAEFRFGNDPFLIATRINRTRRNTPEITNLIFSNRYKNTDSAHLVTPLSTAFHRPLFGNSPSRSRPTLDTAKRKVLNAPTGTRNPVTFSEKLKFRRAQ